MNEENSRDYYLIQSMNEIKTLQRDMSKNMEKLVNTFSQHMLEDAKNLGEIHVAISKLEEKDKVITKSASLIWSGIVSAGVAVGSTIIGHFLKKPN